MRAKTIQIAIGLMSGTSLDGVDAALIRTDGEGFVEPIGFISEAYSPALREALRSCFGKEHLDAAGKEAERQMTRFHAKLVKNLMNRHPEYIPDIIGFHGQTILHDVPRKITVQIGDANFLARETGVDVVHDFRSADVLAGGQGAPLAPLYHAARASQDGLDKPVAFLNIGGVANITWIGPGSDEFIAFDTGTGNAMMDDYAKKTLGMDYDPDGVFASRGQVDDLILLEWMSDPYFKKQPPKSLDRNEWDIAAMGPLAKGLVGLSAEDALATLMEFSVQGILNGVDLLPLVPNAIYVSGGGRHNNALMKRLYDELCCDIYPVERLGWDGDATEAECFGFLAVRSLKGLPISYPGTTGVPEPMSGGKISGA